MEKTSHDPCSKFYDTPLSGVSRTPIFVICYTSQDMDDSYTELLWGGNNWQEAVKKLEEYRQEAKDIYDWYQAEVIVPAGFDPAHYDSENITTEQREELKKRDRRFRRFMMQCYDRTDPSNQRYVPWSEFIYNDCTKCFGIYIWDGSRFFREDI